jgi:orotidine-5'-phosphate decarboxylase
MIFFERLQNRQIAVNSMVCVGLDTDQDLIPKDINWAEDPVLAFNKAIIDATAEFVCAFKINIAFYSVSGWLEIVLQDTINYIQEKYSEIPIILDAKNGDIANSAEKYVREAFTRFKVDAVTINPYLGQDSCQPFLEQKDKGIFVLCKTSNPGSKEFQDLRVHIKDHNANWPLYQQVACRVANFWNSNKNCGLVVGASYPEALKAVRQVVGKMIILVPGVGNQGGTLEAVMRSGANNKGRGLVISASRSIIYASNGSDFAEVAAKEVVQLKNQINGLRKRIRK